MSRYICKGVILEDPDKGIRFMIPYRKIDFRIQELDDAFVRMDCASPQDHGLEKGIQLVQYHGVEDVRRRIERVLEDYQEPARSAKGQKVQGKTLTGMLNELTETICDRYCKYPEEIENEDDLLKKCLSCPLEMI